MSTSIARRVSQTMIDRYGALNGDNDRLHYDVDYARARGFRGTIAHGMMLLGAVYEAAAAQFGPQVIREGHIHLKWVSPVFADDDVTLALDDDGHVQVRDSSARLLITGFARPIEPAALE